MKNVLVAVLGISPAVITEAFYYYAQRHSPPIHFSEVHVFTTSTGRDQLMRTLLGSRPGEDHFLQLLKDLQVSAHDVTFNRNTIHVFTDREGAELVDVRTSEDSQCVADQICRKLSNLASQPDLGIYATIAGGRKTMGLYMAMAMQLLSRPQDRLFHVLLDPRLGEPPPRDFFYPSREFVTGDSHIPTADIRIDCDEIPLLSWPSQVRPSGAVHFRDLLAQQQLCLQSLQEPPNLVIDGKKKQIFIGEFLALKLEPKELYYYSLVASLAACKPARRLPARELGQWFHEVTQEWARDKNSLGSAGYIPKPFIQNLSETQGQDSAFSLYREMFRHYAATRCESPSDARPAKFQREFRSDFELDAKENPTVLQTFSRINNKLKKVIKDPRLLDLYVIRKGKHTRGEPEEKSTYGIWLNSSLIQVSI